MKLLHIGKAGNIERFAAPDSYLFTLDRVEAPIGLSAEEYIALAGDADFIVADAIGDVPGALIENMPKLRLSSFTAFMWHKYQTASTAVRICPITVAMAAPVMPICRG